MQSDKIKTLFNQLSDIAEQIEEKVLSNDFTEFNQLFENHNIIMADIKQMGLIYDKKFLSVIQNSDEKIKKAIFTIKRQQEEILGRLSASSNKRIISNAYDV